MKRLNYIKSLSKKQSLIEQAKTEYKHIVYILPKKYYKELTETLEGVTVFFYEDISKTNDAINGATPESLLILDSCARYKNIGTDKFRRLSRISRQYTNKIIIDTIHFASEIEFIYLPLSYIDRDILGYQHYYAFRENNSEMQNGEKVASHDLRLNAKKLAPYAYQEYDSFLENIAIETVEVPLTISERGGYEEKKQWLFKEYDRFNPIVTALCDFSNIQESVYQAISDVLESANGNVVLYTNIKSHNRRLSKKFPKQLVRTFYDANGDEEQFDTVILCEVPIVRSYLFTDILARLKPKTKVIIIKPNTPAIKLVYERMSKEYRQLDDFSKILKEEIEHESRK